VDSHSAEWDRATRIALEAYEAALRSGGDNGWAVASAVAQMRTIVPSVTESDVRRALSIMLAEKKLAARTASRATQMIPSIK
jgi:hypothetical protein